MDSTRASAIRLLTSSRSMILSGPGRALKPAPMWRVYIVSSGGVWPRSPFRLIKEVINAHSPSDDRHHLHVRRIRRRRRLGQGTAEREGGQRGRDRLVLGRLDRLPGRGDQPRREGRGRVVRPAGAALPGGLGVGDRVRPRHGDPQPVPRPLRRDRSEPEAGRRQADGRATEAAQQERRGGRLSGSGPRLPRRLSAVLQRGRGAGRLEALHGLLREEPARLARELYAAGEATSTRTERAEPVWTLARTPRSSHAASGWDLTLP